jgi:mono/diheme cytochrome c family protein
LERSIAMHTVTRALLTLTPIVGCALALSSCGGGEGDSGASASKPSVPGSIARGKELFDLNCALCHGESGAGDGPGAAGLAVQPRNLNTEPYKYVEIGGHPSEAEALVAYLKVGRIENGMPPYSHLSEADLGSLALYVESLRPRAGFVEEEAGTGED